MVPSPKVMSRVPLTNENNELAPSRVNVWSENTNSVRDPVPVCTAALPLTTSDTTAGRAGRFSGTSLTSLNTRDTCAVLSPAACKTPPPRLTAAASIPAAAKKAGRHRRENGRGNVIKTRAWDEEKC
jgi:hypothetical protein